MATGAGWSAYLDVPVYLRAATHQETASLVGLNTVTGDVVAAGAMSLPVASTTGWAAGPLWMLDGPWSEMAQVVAAPDATHLTLAAPGLQFAHAAGVSASQAGTGGALAEIILRASGWIERYCRQGTTGDRSLFAISRTERWGMPSTRAWLDGDGMLALRPAHFPVQGVTALGVEFGPGRVVSFDATQIEAPSDGRLVELPYRSAAALTPGQRLLLQMGGVSRGTRQWVTITYTGGITAGAVPADIQQACVWVVSDLLAQRRNPAGAAVVRQGKFELAARLRGDTTGDSVLLMHAKEALEAYRAEAM